MRGWRTHSRFLDVTSRDEGAGVFPSRSGTPVCVCVLAEAQTLSRDSQQAALCVDSTA